MDGDEPSAHVGLEGIVADSLRPLAGAMTGLLAFFTLAEYVLQPAPMNTAIAIVDGLSTFAFLVLWIRLRNDQVAPGFASPLVAGMAALALLDSLFIVAILDDPSQAVFAMLVVVGAGVLLLSWSWLTGVLVGSAVGWLAVMLRHPSGEWINFSLGLIAAMVLSCLAHQVRMNAYGRIVALRTEDAQQKRQLEMRGQALQSAVLAAQESEERYRRLVDNAPDAFLVHSGGRIAYANDAAARLFGAGAPQELLGRDISTLVHPEDAARVQARVRQIIDEGRATAPLEMRALRLDGSPVHVETMGTPITYMGEPADQTVIRDITERKLAESERLVAARRLEEIARLQEIDRLKTQFVNTVSHELRTPLTPIKVQLHILRAAEADPDPAKRRRAREMLERNITRLGALVDDLLEVARIQSNNFRLQKRDVDVGAIIAEALESFEPVASAAGVKLESHVLRGLEIDGDPHRLTQVLFNLLHNAVKFTSRGGSIGVEAVAQGGEAIVRVRDTGTGMKPEDIARLFEPFSQVHDTMQQTRAGTGLGLYICRGLVEAHGGRIWAESEGLGKGATFGFAVPLRAHEGEIPLPPQAKRAEIAG